jgi:hypothetical protein
VRRRLVNTTQLHATVFRPPLGALVVGYRHALFTAEHLRLQLKWTHQFQFAGYYAALEQGY